MGLFQNLLETYERCAAAVGIVQVDADGNANEKKTLLPICHMTFKSKIHITIDSGGNFVSASRDSKEKTIIIPCTEKSAGRASGIAAHPLCDQLDYVGGIHDEKTKAYLAELDAWKDGIAELNAIYTYVSGRTIIDDLSNSSIFKDNEYQEKNDGNARGEIDTEKIRKIGVRFTVETGDTVVNVWESKDLRNTWINHISSSATCDDNTFDYLSGEIVGSVAAQHPKNINSYTGNAKLLSCNDASGFTFRGRFAKQDDAVIVDSIQSQKMHQMLRWLIANYGYAVDSQVIVTWAVDSDPEVKVKPQDNSLDVFGEMQAIKTDADILAEASAGVYADYADKLNKLLQGYGDAKRIKQHFCKICIAVFDAATTGRMGLVFYQELPENTYLESIVGWHKDTSYFQTAWKNGKDESGKDKRIPVPYIGAPSYDEILFAVYGISHGDKAYDVLKKKTRKQLLECMFGNFAFPRSMVDMAANRASRPMTFSDANGKFRENDWKRSINITCALARKFYKQQGRELELALNTERTDRDYLFGRLLAVADRLERTALYKAGKQETRATNAVKLMSAFQVKPNATWGQIFSQLIPYKNQMNGAGYYQALIDEIMDLFQDGDFEDNAPLSPLYLLGYSAQNRVLSQKNKNEKSEEADDGGIGE
ncbi:MAG: type I-C CRISPR-associated protein Cas8c/Csd1 [Candidatus Pelethousia sp.]|nr:type I-C CRISPR-associated protein Cas8c/Csd1 [Candidatus Pelethousia sp.]